MEEIFFSIAVSTTNPFSNVQAKGEKEMRIALYTLDEWDHVCPTIRVIAPARCNGLEVIQGCRWEDGSLSCYPEKVKEADIVVIQRDFPRYLDLYDRVVSIAKATGKPIVYEIDDWLPELPPRHPDFERYRPARIPMLSAIVDADLVTCPSPVLAKYVRELNERVVVLPNYLDEHIWAKALVSKPSRYSSDRPVIIGYMGGHSHVVDLDWIRVVLIEILRKYGERVKLRFVGFCGHHPLASTEGWKNVEWVEIGFVNYAEFAEYFSSQTFDFFIAPLVNSPFNRAKSSLKFLEYSILGVPGVYSSLPPFESVVIHGENGFLAATLRDWRNYIERLIEEPDLRAEIGAKARRTVMENWLLSDHAYQWIKAYEQAISLKTIQTSVFLKNAKPLLRKMQKWDEENLQFTSQFQNQLENYWAEIQAMETRLTQRDSLLNEILTSPGWKLVTTLGSFRARLMPPGSYRERVFFTTMALFSKMLKVLREARGVRTQKTPRTLSDLALVASFGEKPCFEDPLISLVIDLRDPCAIDVGAIQEWLALQTYPIAEIVVWDSSEGKASRLGSEVSWPAFTVEQLKRGLQGKYVCLVSLNLLCLPETCLEMNLVALEGENLAFTVNWVGEPTIVRPWLRSGCVPRLFEGPCVFVVRKEYLDEGLSLNLEKAGGSDNPVKVGKIITYHMGKEEHRYQEAILQPGPAIRTSKPGMLRVEGADIVLAPLEGAGQESKLGQLCPLNEVLPLVPMPKERKQCVLVVMPFLAVGGAERIALEIMYQLKDDICFAVVTVEKHIPYLGNMVHLFLQVTPYIFTAFDWMAPDLRLPFFEYILRKMSPRTLYIANGSGWIYNVLATIKEHFPELRIVNQVYDHRVGWINRYDARLVELIDAHIGCNEKICHAYQERGVPRDRVYLIGNGVDTGQFDPNLYPEERRKIIREELGLPQGKRVVTFMGRLHPQKRPMDFVELARRFSDDPSLVFLMVGDGPLAGAVDAVLQRAKLSNLVRRSFLQATDVLAVSDLIVLPSEYEGMPMVILEAQSMGKPVVVTDVGIVDTTSGGIVIKEIGNVDALAKGVKTVLENPPNPARIREAVVAYFDVRKVAADYRRALLGE
ncbi:MAG: glycosyltransferase [Anaerolineae bacterium]|nr:glycosyltransferase [Anaerolineae bacterium]